MSGISEQNFDLRQQVMDLEEGLTSAVQQIERYKQAFDFLEQTCKKSYTGVSFDFFRDGNYTSYRMMRRHNLYNEADSLLAAVEVAMKYEGKE